MSDITPNIKIVFLLCFSTRQKNTNTLSSNYYFLYFEESGGF